MPRFATHMLHVMLASWFASSAADKALDKAIADDNAAMVNIALKSGPRAMINTRGQDGDTPLLTAVRNGKHRALKALIKGKADLTVADANGLTAMHIAASIGSQKVILPLLTAGVDPNSLHEDGLRPIHRAVLKGHTDAVKAFLNAEVPVDEPTSEGRTPMQLADTLTAKEAGAMKEVLGKFSRTAKSEL